jgi:methylated-DNA-protein-cysteine methyltransferase-like protein
MAPVDREFRDRVFALVAQIPKGKVMTYGQIAALCGSPRAARIVGGIAHFGVPDLPWQRVVMKDGSLASGYPGGVHGHKAHLEAEGVTVSDEFKVMDMENRRWNPGL